jgi:predicted PurR-regulated permease PerM
MNNTTLNSPPWSTQTRLWVSLIGLAILAWLMVAAFPLIENLVIAAMLAYLLEPVVRYLVSRWHWRRSKAVLLVWIAGALLLFGLIPMLLGAIFVEQYEHWASDLQAAVQGFQKWISQPIILFGVDFSPRMLLTNLGQAAGGSLSVIRSGSLDILMKLTKNLLSGLVILISLYYFLRDGSKLKTWLVSLAPPAYQQDMNRLLDEINQTWSIFLRAQILIFAILILLMVVGSFVIIWLHKNGLLHLSVLGMILILVVLYILIIQLDHLWLRPRLMGQRLNLHPGLVYISFIGALTLSGLFGALLVVPCVATAKFVGSYVHRKMLGLPPWPEQELVSVKEEVEANPT